VRVQRRATAALDRGPDRPQWAVDELEKEDIMTLHLRRTIVGILATLAVAACTVPAQATMIEVQHYSFAESTEDVICGITVRNDFSGSGVFHLRVGKGDLDTLFFVLDKYNTVSTLTNEANGNFVRIEHNGGPHDIKGTLVEASIFKAVTTEAGQLIRIRDMTGRIVALERGVIRQTYLFDTQGDHTPGGVFIEQIDVRVKGPHPLILDFDNTFCGIVRPLLLA
jgi:hypothetical protein